MFSTENVSGAIALIIVLGMFVLLALGQVVPSELWQGFALVLGFFFGNAAGNARARLTLSK